MEAAKEEARTTGKTPKKWQDYWIKELGDAQKRSRRFRNQGTKTVDRYLGHTDERVLDTVKLNLFHSDINTLKSMLYGNVPQVDVSRKDGDPQDDVARVAATILQRMLQNDIEASGEKFDSILKSALEDRLLPGLGVARVRYEAEYEQTQATIAKVDDGSGVAAQITPPPQLLGEYTPVDYVNWDDCRWSYARTWAEVWWFGFRSYLTKEKATKRFGSEKAGYLTYKNRAPSEDSDTNTNQDDDVRDTEETAEVWEIWCETTQEVFWVSKGCAEILDQRPDTLKMEGFYPIPRPMVANITTKLFMPKADYVFAQDLYDEIDLLQTRISIITEAIKVVGVYDEGAGDSVGRMLNEGVENNLIPVSNWAVFGEKGGLRGAIDWMPIEQAVTTVRELQVILDKTIERLYQVTGMSDIMRGALSDAREGVGQSQIKAQFASVRVQALEEDFARFASDIQSLKAEIIAKHYSAESIIVQSNAMHLQKADHDKIGPALELIKDPDIQWRVEIRAESIAMIDYGQMQSQRTEFLNATAMYMQSSAPLIAESPESAPMLMAMLQWGLAGFKGADEIEGVLDQAIEASMKGLQEKEQNPEPDAEQQKAQAQQQAQQFEMQKLQMQNQMDMQQMQTKFQQDTQLQTQKFQQDMMEERQSFQNDMKKIMADFQADMAKQGQKVSGDLNTEATQAALDMAVDDNATRNKLIEDNHALDTTPGNPQTDPG